MNNVYFGIVLGIIICFGGERLFAYVMKTLKERKEKEAEKAKENLVTIIKTIIEKK